MALQNFETYFFFVILLINFSFTINLLIHKLFYKHIVFHQIAERT